MRIRSASKHSSRLAAGLLTTTLLAGVPVVAAAATAGRPAQHAAAASAGSTLVLANAVKVDTLDPEANSLNESIWLDQNLYSRLYQPNASGTALLPDLATGYTVSDHNLVYTFHLRSAKYCNGQPVTASDVAFSIKRTIAFSGGWGFLLTALKSVTAPNPSTVVFTLSQPHAPLVADLAMYAYSVVPEVLVKKQGAAFFNMPIGSGPFCVSSYNPNSEVDLKPNPYYYGARPKISEVRVLIVPDANTRTLLLESGKADVIENPPSNLVSEIDNTGKAKVDLFPSTQVNFIQLDEHYAPFKNVLVRQAINYAIDRAAIVKLAWQGNATPAGSFFPYHMLYYDNSIQPYPYDPAKAKQLLAKAGYAKGFNTFIITTSGSTSDQATALVIKSELQAVGINVTIDSYEQTTAYTKEDNGHSQMGLRYWTNDILDPDEVATFGADSTGGANAFNSYWVDPQVNHEVETARATITPSTRQMLYNEVQQAVYTQSPFVVLDYSPYLYGVANYVHGFHVTPVGNYDLSLETLTVGSH
jgi:peptide/nickel transport system substrate-binding protein